ncbi:hypothetical protein OK016_20830 [Vibrio chagasii]|nr:hypothetical protein [Vibrio chagasii]
MMLEHLLQSLPCESEHPHHREKTSTLINDIARDLERLNQNEKAVHWFKKSSLPPGRRRLARIYDKQDELNLMSDTVTEMQTNPSDVSELEVAVKRAAIATQAGAKRFHAHQSRFANKLGWN